MAREFLTRTQNDDDDHIAANIASREAELAAYDANIVLYTQQLAALTDVPETIPTELERFKGKANEQIFALGATAEEAASASDWNHRERIKLLLFTEQAECKKSELAYAALLDALPEGARRTAALERLAAKKGV